MIAASWVILTKGNPKYLHKQYFLNFFVTFLNPTYRIFEN